MHPRVGKLEVKGTQRIHNRVEPMIIGLGYKLCQSTSVEEAPHKDFYLGLRVAKVKKLPTKFLKFAQVASLFANEMSNPSFANIGKMGSHSVHSCGSLNVCQNEELYFVDPFVNPSKGAPG